MARPKTVCSIPECSRKHFGNGYCQAHYLRIRRGQSLNKPIGKNPNGFLHKKSGYMVTKINQHNVPVHRLIMEQHLGRNLLPEEEVHHINGIRTDNRLENLELWSHSHPYGQRVEDLLNWATEIIKIYGK